MIMATLTSTHRGTPTLAVAPTQNTAPVHEYRCLYTRDLHKKTKKWHDGSLRFHTFNSRVMVYDDAKNYIGDLHYRQEEEFSEGVEIQLDRGIKVEVGERFGETQTDLAPILDRQRPDKVAQQPKQSAVGITRVNVGIPSQRPKSLLEVLGPSQGRLGRSRLPIQSPYEQRQTFVQTEPAEQPSKRLRLSIDKENQPQHAQEFTASRTPERRSRLPQQVSTNSTNPPTAIVPRPASTPSISFEEVMDISSDEEMQRASLKAMRLATVHNRKVDGRQTSKVNLTVASRGRTGKPLQPPEPARRKASEKVATSRHEQRINCAPKSQQTMVVADVTSSRQPESATARLLLSQLRPREKLTYLRPIPSVYLSNRCGYSASKTSTESAKKGAASPIHIETSSPIASTPASALRSVVQSPLSSLDNHADEDNPFMSSPLFVPEENPELKSPSPSPLPIEDGLSSPAFGRPPCSLARESATDRQSPIAKKPPLPRIDFMEDRPMRAGFEMSQPEPGPEEPRTSVLNPKPANSPTVVSTTRTFRRVLSANDAFGGRDLVQDSNDVIEGRSPLRLLENLASRRGLVKSRSPAKVHRCASDTAAMDTDKGGPGEKHLETSPTGEKGPWTSEEAFLLFDWWPSELEKPEIWKVAEQLPQPLIAPTTIQEFSTRITTARQFFHSDINAL